MEIEDDMPRCMACLQTGHTRNNRKCPNYGKEPTDFVTEKWLKKRYESVKRFTLESAELSVEVGNIIRMPNLPEDLTENIAKFIIRNYLGDSSCMWCKSLGMTGDLKSDTEKIQEVKSFTSDGPSSFGPKKKFDVLYFLDLRKWLEDEIVLFRVNLTNQSPDWTNIKMNKAETFGDMAGDGKRPHISWERIRSQLPPSVVTEVYRGSFDGIFTHPAKPERVELSIEQPGQTQHFLQACIVSNHTEMMEVCIPTEIPEEKSIL
jgi:hypothetical protein